MKNRHDTEATLEAHGFTQAGNVWAMGAWRVIVDSDHADVVYLDKEHGMVPRFTVEHQSFKVAEIG